MTGQALTVDVYSDVVCPWCYIGKRRLEQARRALLTTDLPVGLVAYRNGYGNNAAFTRAFGRRFGQSPSDCRARVAA